MAGIFLSTMCDFFVSQITPVFDRPEKKLPIVAFWGFDLFRLKNARL